MSSRPSSACNFLPLPPLLAPPPSAEVDQYTNSSSYSGRAGSNYGLSSSYAGSSVANVQPDQPSLVTYRHYATLYFIVISTSTESPLALLDLIQVFVEALDRLFENVCELDLIYNFETLHAVLGEMIVGGVVVETGLDKVVQGVKAQGTVAKRPVNEGSTSRARAAPSIWTGR